MTDNELLTSEAALNICLLKKNFVISAFVGKIVFGEIKTCQYIANCRVVIYRSEYGKFYESILSILRTISEVKEQRGVLVSNGDEVYGWEVKADLLIFYVEVNSDITFKTAFSFHEFNNLLDCFKELIPLSLLLRDDEIDLIIEVSLLDLKKLKEFENTFSIKKYLTSISKLNRKNIILISLNLDIVVLLHKLHNLISLSYREDLLKYFNA